MNKLLLLTSVLTLIFTSLSFAKTYSIKKEKEGKYVEISQGDIESKSKASLVVMGTRVGRELNDSPPWWQVAQGFAFNVLVFTLGWLKASLQKLYLLVQPQLRGGRNDRNRDD